ncbi:hypothetical protein HGRIS_010476 [Hohenbuehelia grisea]|uniref:Uncharacterized protein n=1 Tax=Hohenbuehelia grisea TaxID=104357 RepID=A0ABR3IZQ8_9AGAR
MTKKKWTTPEQLAFLKGNIPGFFSAQATKTTSTFHSQTYRSFVTKWPLPSLTLEEVSKAGGRQFSESSATADDPKEQAAWKEAETKAKVIQKSFWENRLMNWFGNHTRNALWQPWQSYENLYYKDNKEAQKEVKDLYAAYRSSTGDQKPMEYFAFLNKTMRERYDAAPEDVKKRVEEHTLEKSKATTVSEMTPDQLQRAISRLSSTTMAFLDAVEKQAGWSGMVAIGGPVPRCGGSIGKIIAFRGETPSGAQLDAFLGDSWDKVFLVKFDGFLADVYPPDVMESQSLATARLAKDDNTLDDADNPLEVAPQEDEDMHDANVDSDKQGLDSTNSGDNSAREEEDEPMDQDLPEAPSRQPTYEEVRNMKIAENQKLLLEIENKFRKQSGLPALDRPPEVSPAQVAKRQWWAASLKPPLYAGNPRRRHFACTSARCVSNSRSTLFPPSSPQADSAAPAQFNGGPLSASSSDTQPQARIASSTAITPSSPPSSGSSLQDDSGSSGEPVTSSSSPPTSNSPSSSVAAPTATPAQQSAAITEHREQSSASPDPNALNHDSSSPSVPSPGPLAQEKTVDEDAGDSLQHDKADFAPQAAPIYRARLSSAHTDEASRASRLLGKETLIDLMLSTTLPEWVPAEMVAFLRQSTDNTIWDVAESAIWESIIYHYLGLELASDSTGHLSTKGRPEEIPWWTKRHRQVTTIPVIKASEFGSQLQRWWLNLQPAWRKEGYDGDWPLPRNPPPLNVANPWQSLQQHGPNGLLYILLALAWWVKALGTEEEHQQFDEVLIDVHWVITHLALAVKKGGGITTHPASRRKVSASQRPATARTLPMNDARAQRDSGGMLMKRCSDAGEQGATKRARRG